MKLSIIVPILNEVQNIPAITAMLKDINAAHEVIFVDGGSTDGTLVLLPKEFRLVHSPRGRGLQLNKGAAAAQGDVLLFLHCDSILSREAIDLIPKAIETGCMGGCFSLSFDKKGMLLGLIAYLSNLRVRLLRVMFGDQGIFIKRDVFEQLGGFPEIPIMEDLEFSLRLRKIGKVALIKDKIITSPRRFEKNGVLRTILFMHKMKLLYFLGVDPAELARIYKNVR